MRILFSSYSFAPNLGGIESVSSILAERFAVASHEVELITETEGGPANSGTYRITRCPSLLKLLRLVSWADVLFQNNISLPSLILALLLRKRVVVVHQTWLRSPSGTVGWNNRIKRALLPLVTNIAISEAVREHIGVPARIIANPYDEYIFRRLPNTARDKTLIFLGRLVSDKGVDLLLRALKRLSDERLTPDLTIIGTGPEEPGLRQIANQLGIERQVTFCGAKRGEELVELFNRHQILVVPSRWPEPFGIVALEGIACGCAVIGSQDGGLKEAIGPCGLTFENGNEDSLAECLKKLLQHPEIVAKLREPAPSHLDRFRSEAIADQYCRLLENSES